MKELTRYKYATSSAAALIWGSYAYFVNRNGTSSALNSGLLQGISSFGITYISVEALKNLHDMFEQNVDKLILPPLVLLLLTSGLYSSVHYIIKTENIVATLLPNLLAGFTFSLVTCLHLNKKSYQGQ